MTRIVSYNILAGGYSLQADGGRRTQQITRIIHSANPDIVGIIEATNPSKKDSPAVIEEIAANLGMHLTLAGDPCGREFCIALLTHLPIIYTKIHTRPGILGKPLLEVCVKEENGQHLTAFVTHLTAAFNQGRGGGHVRAREAREIIKIMEPLRREGRPHCLMGDFNSLAPGDPFQAHKLLSYVIEMNNINKNPDFLDGVPRLNAIVPKGLRFLKPLLCIIPQSPILKTLFNQAAALYIPRACMSFFSEASYIDCYRQKHPKNLGFTCPAASPAGRIDYILASPDLAERLEACHEIIRGGGLSGKDASDHLPVIAAFGLGVEPQQPAAFEMDSVVPV